jgi:hypothetical protein
LAKETGKFYMDCQEAPIADNAKDDQMANWLWNVSADLTGLNTTEDDGGKLIGL